ncbi:MAG: hypothetical protein KF862_24705 [Chitinophagaceae bacterium]|nr:hypothetical protein [Chitinophagaceae bacterium]
MKEFVKYKNRHIVFFLFLMIPFLQLGFSYYLSVSFLAFLLVIIKSGISIRYSSTLLLMLFLGSFFFIFKSVSLLTYATDLRNILIPCREMICYIGILLISNFIGTKVLINEKQLFNVCFILLLIIFLLVLIQYFFIIRGIYIGIPLKYFVFNKDTIEGLIHAMTFGIIVRPTSFYGEPSYTGWICLSILCIILNNPKVSIERKIVSILLAISIVLLSLTMAGILGIFVFCIIWYLISQNKNLNPLVILATLIVGILIIYFVLTTKNSIGVRLVSILNNEDVSSNIRLNLPANYYEEMLRNGQLFGVSNYGELQIDNAAWGLVLQYGILSICIVLMISAYYKHTLLILYIFISLNFNGAFFRFDKAIITGLVCGFVVYYTKNQNKLRTKKGISPFNTKRAVLSPLN